MEVNYPTNIDILCSSFSEVQCVRDFYKSVGFGDWGYDCEERHLGVEITTSYSTNFSINRIKYNYGGENWPWTFSKWQKKISKTSFRGIAHASAVGII